MNYLQDYTSRNLTLQNTIMIAVVALYLSGLWLGNQTVVDALAVPAGIAIGWAVKRKDGAA